MANPEQAARALLAVVPGTREVLGSCRRCGGTVTVTLVPGFGTDQIEPDPSLEVVELDHGRLVVRHRGAAGCRGTLRLVA